VLRVLGGVGFAVLLALSATTVAGGADDQPTWIYAAGDSTPTEQIIKGHDSGFNGSFGVYTVDGFGGDDLGWARVFEREGVVQFGDVFVDSPLGYLRKRRGAIWYVNRYTDQQPPVVTIGTVRLTRRGMWEAYLGLGVMAHRVGYARGRHAALGAAASLLFR